MPATTTMASSTLSSIIWSFKLPDVAFIIDAACKVCHDRPMSYTKTCTSGSRIPGCGRDLPIAEFYLDTSGKPFNYCKDCIRRRRRARNSQPEETPPAVTSTCVECGETKSSTEFAFKRASGGKPRDECRRCLDARHSKNFRERNKKKPGVRD